MFVKKGFIVFFISIFLISCGSEQELREKGNKTEVVNPSDQNNNNPGQTYNPDQNKENTGDKPITPAKPNPVNYYGQWKTLHTFDLSKAIMGFPSLGKYLGIADQIFKNGLAAKLDKIPIIGKKLTEYLKKQVDNYVPHWVQKLVSGLNSLANALKTLETRGVMNLEAAVNDGEFQGDEKWDTMVINMVQNCKYGTQDPSYPSCAKVNIAMAQHGIKMQESTKITGKLENDTLIFGERKLQVEVFKVYLYLVDLAAAAASGQKDLDSAIQYLVDCKKLKDAAEAKANISLGFVESMCEAGKLAVAKNIKSELAKKTAKWTSLSFKGSVQVKNDGHILNPYGLELISGQWDGNIKVLIDGPMSASWKAIR